MNLDNLRNLKHSILEKGLSAVSTGASMVAAMRSLATTKPRRDGIDTVSTELVLGAVPISGSKFLLAVRTQTRNPVLDLVVEQLRKRVKDEIDVRYVGRITRHVDPTSPAFYQRSLRPLKIGASISDVQTTTISAGTLGCFVKGRSDGKRRLLTNNHVIGNENKNPVGSPVVQPGTLDGGNDPADRIGTLSKQKRLLKTKPNFIDAATAFVDTAIAVDTSTLGNRGAIAGVGDHLTLTNKSPVFKVGRTTGQTEGRITAFEIDNVDVEYSMGVLRFDNQIEIEGTGNAAFSDSGDSGSLIFDADRRAIALLFAGGDVGGSNGMGLTYANPIQIVLDELKVDLET